MTVTVSGRVLAVEDDGGKNAFSVFVVPLSPPPDHLHGSDIERMNRSVKKELECNVMHRGGGLTIASVEYFFSQELWEIRLQAPE